MNPRVLLLLEIAMYSAFPLAFAVLRPAVRLVYFYVYIAIVLTVGGFLGAVHSFPVTDDVTISAGSVAYAALLMSTMLLVIVGHDVRVVRTVVRIVVVVNAFKLALFSMTSAALRSEEYANPFGTSSSLFGASVRVVVAGGLLIVVEVLLLLAVFSWLRARFRDPATLTGLYVLAYVVVLGLDGVLFPVLALTGDVPIGEVIRRGVEGKLLLAVGYAVPLTAFLVIYRTQVAAYQAAPLRLQDLFLATKDDLFKALEERDAALRATEQRLASSLDRQDLHATAAAAIGAASERSGIDEQLVVLGQVLGGIPGLAATAPRLLVLAEGGPAGERVEIAAHGHRTGPATTDPAERHRLGTGPWLEVRELGQVVCVPVLERGELVAMAEVRVEGHDPDASLAVVADLAPEIAGLVRPHATATRDRWQERRPILSILEHRSATALFQPIIRLSDAAVVGFEGLIRFEAGNSPEERFREAALLGYGVELELLALERILEEAGGLPEGAAVAVNMSPGTIGAPRLLRVLAGAGRPITLEITEHEPVDDYDALGSALGALPEVRVCVDDAGSGYASLQHILRLRPDEVKLDRSWVSGIHLDPVRQALVRTLVTFVAELGASIIAEGIEEEAEAAVLAQLGITYGQGYLFGRPAPAADLG